MKVWLTFLSEISMESPLMVDEKEKKQDIAHLYDTDINSHNI